jgi:hypothetical protein
MNKDLLENFAKYANLGDADADGRACCLLRHPTRAEWGFAEDDPAPCWGDTGDLVHQLWTEIDRRMAVRGFTPTEDAGSDENGDYVWYVQK